MIDKPAKTIRDEDLRGSYAALLRAAQRARELAMRTGTRVVVSRGGVIEYLTPPSSGVHEPGAIYRSKP